MTHNTNSAHVLVRRTTTTTTTTTVEEILAVGQESPSDIDVEGSEITTVRPSLRGPSVRKCGSGVFPIFGRAS